MCTQNVSTYDLDTVNEKGWAQSGNCLLFTLENQRDNQVVRKSFFSRVNLCTLSMSEHSPRSQIHIEVFFKSYV